MSKVRDSLREIHKLERTSQKDTCLSTVHPLVKLLLTVLFLLFVTSYSKYNLTGLLGMSIYLVIVFNLGEIELKDSVKNMKAILLLLLIPGLANLIIDREILDYWIGFPITGGMISFLTLYIKGVFSLFASYALILSTGMENICYALEKIHFPRMMIAVIMLIYRYLIQFLKEVDRLSLAYSLRAGGQRGIHKRAWGSMVGTMLLRSMDQANTVHESMSLRGFTGYYRTKLSTKISWKRTIGYFIIMGIILIFLRVIPVFELLGNLF